MYSFPSISKISIKIFLSKSGLFCALQLQISLEKEDSSMNFYKISIDVSKINDNEITRLRKVLGPQPLMNIDITVKVDSCDRSEYIQQVLNILKFQFKESDDPFSDELMVVCPSFNKSPIKYKNCWNFSLQCQPIVFKTDIETSTNQDTADQLNTDLYIGCKIVNKLNFSDPKTQAPESKSYIAENRTPLNKFERESILLSSTYAIYVPNTNIPIILKYLQIPDCSIETVQFKGPISIYLAYLLADTVKKRPLINILSFLIDEKEKIKDQKQLDSLNECILLFKYLISEYSKLPSLHFQDVLLNMTQDLPKHLLIALVISFMCYKNNLRCFSDIDGGFIVGDIDSAISCNAELYPVETPNFNLCSSNLGDYTHQENLKNYSSPSNSSISTKIHNLTLESKKSVSNTEKINSDNTGFEEMLPYSKISNDIDSEEAKNQYFFALNSKSAPQKNLNDSQTNLNFEVFCTKETSPIWSVPRNPHDFILKKIGLTPRKGKTVIYCEQFEEIQLPIFYKRKANDLLRYIPGKKILIASGIGIAAFLNFIKKNQTNGPVIVIYGIRHKEDDLTRDIDCSFQRLIWKGEKIQIQDSGGQTEATKYDNMEKSKRSVTSTKQSNTKEAQKISILTESCIESEKNNILDSNILDNEQNGKASTDKPHCKQTSQTTNVSDILNNKNFSLQSTNQNMVPSSLNPKSTVLTHNTIIYVTSTEYRLENLLQKFIAPLDWPVYICGSHTMQKKVYPMVSRFETVFIDRWD